MRSKTMAASVEHVVAKIMGPPLSWGGGTLGSPKGNDGPWDDGQTGSCDDEKSTLLLLAVSFSLLSFCSSSMALIPKECRHCLARGYSRTWLGAGRPWQDVQRGLQGTAFCDGTHKPASRAIIPLAWAISIIPDQKAISPARPMEMATACSAP